MRKRKQKALNNKGFSLVELIVVITIMAILVGVMAPNLFRYVEKTNVAADIQLADSVRTAIQVAIMDPSVPVAVRNSLNANYRVTGASAKGIADMTAGEVTAIISTLPITATDGPSFSTAIMNKVRSSRGTGSAMKVTIDAQSQVTVSITETDNTGGKDVTNTSLTNDIVVPAN